MSDSNSETHIGIIASAAAGMGTVYAIIRLTPKLCKSVIGGMRTIIRFSDAIPSILELPARDRENKRILHDQNEVLAGLVETGSKLIENEKPKMALLGELRDAGIERGFAIADLQKRVIAIEQRSNPPLTVKT